MFYIRGMIVVNNSVVGLRWVTSSVTTSVISVTASDTGSIVWVMVLGLVTVVVCPVVLQMLKKNIH